MGQWLLWKGSLVPQIQAHTCCQGTHLYICGQWCREAITDCVYGFAACHSEALIPDFSCTMSSQQSHWLLVIVPDEAAWPFLSLEQLMLCNVFCSWFLFFRPMNFNNFFFHPLCRSRVFHSVSLHCRILFLLLPFRTPIATCPVEKQSCETQSKMETAEGMSISSNRLRGQVFFSCGGKIRLMSNLRSSELKCAEDNLCWMAVAEVGVNIKMCWIRYETAVLKSMSTYLNSPSIPWYEYIWQLLLIFLLASNQPKISQRMPRVSIRIH